MTCEHAEENMLDYINGQLDAPARGALLAHIASCARCRGEIARLLVLKRALLGAMEEVPEDIERAAFARIGLAQSELERILSRPSGATAFELISYALETAGQALYLPRRLLDCAI